MASRAFATTALLLTLNLLFFTLVTSTHPPKNACPPPPPAPCPPPPPKPCPPPPKSSTPKPPSPSVTPPKPSTPKPPSPSVTPPKPSTPKPPSPTPTTPKTPPSVTPPKMATCPRDTLKLGVCANLLNDLVNLVIGTPSNTPCCTLIGGLTDLEAAVCLCTAIKANILGINLNVPVSLSLLLNNCGKKVPSGFECS